MSDFNTYYQILFPDGAAYVYGIRLDGESLERVPQKEPAYPSWTRLDFNQCVNCPYNVATTPHCPVAVNLVKLVDDMGKFVSHEQVSVEVTTPERVVRKRTTLQRAVSSLLGLIIATSDCPHTVYFKPMARFHLPLASEEETIYRATSMYLLAQYFLFKDGRPVDWELKDLAQIYKNLQMVNHAMAKRLRAASEKDTAVNAIVLLDLFAKALPYTIDESLEKIRYMFGPYLAARH